VEVGATVEVEVPEVAVEEVVVEEDVNKSFPVY
jgi:hypothetical protein